MQLTYDDTAYTGPRFRYGLQYRPKAPGAVPKGFIVDSDRLSSEYRYGTLDYPSELSREQVSDYELIFVGEFTGDKIAIKRAVVSHCQNCGKDFDSPELVYFAPIDGNIVCTKCSEIHRERQLSIYVKEE